MRHPILLVAFLALPAVPALAQGFPGATVGIPLGKPDPFGTATRPPAQPMAEPFADPSADRGVAQRDRRLRSQPRRLLKGDHRAEPKRRPPLARR
ncbi:hypothetical protein [Methylorubrum aminovorans]